MWTWTAPKSMWKPPSAIWATYFRLVVVVIELLLLAVVRPAASSESCCQSSLQSTSLSRYAARCSQLVFGQLCSTAVTWAPNASDLQRLRRNDRAMIRWICGAKLADNIPTAVLHQKLDLDEITAVLRTRPLRWYGHVQRATSCINSITRLELPGTRDRGRPRKTWSACVRNDMTICNLGWCQPVRQEFMENECEALPRVAYPGVRDNRSTLNTKTGYDDESDIFIVTRK